jgi:hypothetical protein
VQGAANTLVAWIPSEPHGTSLQDVDPSDSNPAFCQRGLAFVTSNRLPSVWQKYIQGQITHANATQAATEDSTE